MECRKCKKECMENELENGFCFDCIEKYGNNSTELKSTENDIAKYFKIWSIVAIIAGAILAFVSLVFEYGVFSFFTCILSSLVIAAFLRAIAEIIQLLEDIKNK